MDTIRVELLIVGGGLAGMTLALACAGAGIETALVDREAPERVMAAPFDGRTTALAWSSARVMETLGLRDDLAGEVEPIHEIRVADGGSRLHLHYDHHLVGDHPLGFIVENRVLRRTLYERLRRVASLTYLAPVAVESVAREKDGACATLGDGRRILAQLVAACDGQASPLRKAAGISSLIWTYPQTGIVCTVRHDEPHRGIAVEHFLPAGPFAILPMTRQRSSIVWTERSDLAPALVALDPRGFHRELLRRFGDHLGALEIEGPRWSYPLSFLLAREMSAPRLALVGEAAHAIHPIAGQGFNLGIRDVAALAELIVDRRRLGLDIGGAVLLQSYERSRRLDTALLAGVTDGLNRLFSNDVAPVRIARDLGLAAVDRMAPLKRLFMRHAMGVAGDQPRLVRGEAL
jgi:2-octaprenyl-6-methoxyphenol hydroxylase